MTGIYAIRDRLIDYFMRPFAAQDDKEVLASIAHAINQGDNSAISQTPHHFEIWRLGSVTEEGDLRAGKELIADCSSLIRNGIRRTGVSGASEPEKAPDRRTGPSGGDRGEAATNPRLVPIAPPSASGAG